METNTTFFRNSQAAFKTAIDLNILSTNPKNENFAGNYMYMGSDANEDRFKNINTRKYLYSPIRGINIPQINSIGGE